ncbi:MAG: GNAT family N-acetyltransferase [Chitinophagaceae bacterium]|nr:GNAT family N-acetyltransferase [Chitinophagaceae bacterium]
MQISPDIINSAENKEYTISRLNRENIKDVAKLYAAVYNVEVEENYFVSKYDALYTGIETIGVIAYDKNTQPVAYYGVVPCFMQFENKIVLAAQSVDTMTHPQHRYKGLFHKLSNIAFDLCSSIGIKLIFGFPNQHSFHGLMQSGWKMSETMYCFRIPVNSLPLQSLSKKIFFFRKKYASYGDFIVKKDLLPCKGIPNSVVADGFAGVHRSENYLQYKAYNPTKVIQFGEAQIWVSIKQGLIIGDIAGANENNFDAVIDQLKKMAKKLGIRQILFHCSPGTRLHTMFSAKYESTPSFPVIFKDFESGIPLEKIKFTFSDIDIF